MASDAAFSGSKIQIAFLGETKRTIPKYGDGPGCRMKKSAPAWIWVARRATSVSVQPIARIEDETGAPSGWVDSNI